MVEHPPRVWVEAACLSDQPFLLREGSLAECIWSGWQTHKDSPALACLAVPLDGYYPLDA